MIHTSLCLHCMTQVCKHVLELLNEEDIYPICNFYQKIGIEGNIFVAILNAVSNDDEVFRSKFYMGLSCKSGRP